MNLEYLDSTNFLEVYVQSLLQVSHRLDRTPILKTLDKYLGTGQYLWEYGTGTFATGPLVIFVPHLDGATGYIES